MNKVPKRRKKMVLSGTLLILGMVLMSWWMIAHIKDDVADVIAVLKEEE